MSFHTVALCVDLSDVDNARNVEVSGHSSSEPKMEKLVVGSNAEVNQFPFHADIAFEIIKYLLFKTDRWCGGSVISPTWILSAAFCTEK